ncbi:MAG: DUF4115 domain-containing protein [Betaproteobacteria bacterium]|nr:DUF4115 domain-containing protein [Betaproteobacteria bacterium]
MSDPMIPYAVEPAAPDPFAVLARRREALGMKFGDVAQQLKFTPRQIEALEAADFAHLPTGTFARGMLRSYARLLKLDPAPMLAALSQRMGDATPMPEHSAALRASVPFSDGGRRVNVVYVALSAGFLLAAGALLFEWTQDRGSAAPLAFVPAAQTPPAAVSGTPPTMVSSAAPLPVIVRAETTAPPEHATELASADGTRRINLRFEREAWVEITDRAGRRLISQLNPAGSEQSVEGRPPFAVIIGNATYVKLSYDRRPIDLSPHVKVEVARLTLD